MILRGKDSPISQIAILTSAFWWSTHGSCRKGSVATLHKFVTIVKVRQDPSWVIKGCFCSSMWVSETATRTYRDIQKSCFLNDYRQFMECDVWNMIISIWCLYRVQSRNPEDNHPTNHLRLLVPRSSRGRSCFQPSNTSRRQTFGGDPRNRRFQPCQATKRSYVHAKGHIPDVYTHVRNHVHIYIYILCIYTYM